MPNVFKNFTDQDVLDLVTEYPLALLVHPASQKQTVLPLPMLPDADESGRLTSLTGHMALRNPLVNGLKENPRTLFIFQGPNGYISPTIVSRPGWGPTWNYSLAWIEADITLHPDNNHAALQRLVHRLEGEQPEDWSTDEMGERYELLANKIIAFEASVVSVDATFKLGQDEEDSVFSEIAARTEDRSLRRWMERFRQ
jgi:transcriptional regulator